MWYTVTWVLVPLGSVLLCAALIWNGPLRRGLEGSKGSLRGILMSHLWPSLSYLQQCGGCKALEQVGKPLTLSKELWPAVSFKPSLPCLWTKSYWAHMFCFMSCVSSHLHLTPLSATFRENIYFTIEPLPPHAGCRAQTCVEHLREKSGGSLPFTETLPDVMCLCVL